jgi:MerR family transcriptional regulator, light-induced transcriptional regulator
VAETGLSAGEAARRIGVAVTTIRTWDRRYGLGPSYREPGRHRRYSQDDLARLELMRRLTVDGVAPAEAARIAKAADPVRQAPKEIAGEGPDGLADQPPPDVGPSPGRPSSSAARAPATAKGLRRASLALDPADVDRLLDLALARGVVPGWTTVIAPALRDLGNQYPIAGRYIAAEHLLSGAVSIALARVPRPATRPQVLLACTPAEQHCLPLEALAAALAERGAASRMLGARMPTHALQEALVRTGPAAVLIWSHTPATADYQQLAAAAKTRPRPPLVAACGPGWEPASLPDGIALLTSLQQAVDTVTQLPKP